MQAKTRNQKVLCKTQDLGLEVLCGLKGQAIHGGFVFTVQCVCCCMNFVYSQIFHFEYSVLCVYVYLFVCLELRRPLFYWYFTGCNIRDIYLI